MEFIEGKCPKCGGELRLPKDFEKILCMYCGEELTRNNLQGEKTDINFKENYDYAVEHIAEIVTAHKAIMQTFKKNLYEDSMKDYTEDVKPIFKALEKACTVSSMNREKILRECADAVIIGVIADLDQNKELKNKKKRNDALDNYKIMLALYTVPMLGLQKTESADSFIDILMNRWVEEFPKMVFQKGTFEDINSGFRKGKWCYITTAVCESLNKPDDCYELTMFRQFRDDYMLQQPIGDALVQEYYDLAPTIVEHIDLSSNRNQIYKEIWKKDLSICLKNIEMGNPEACMEHYMKMVRKLQQQYI